MNQQQRRDTAALHKRSMTRMERVFVKPVMAAIKSQINKVIAVLKIHGPEAARRENDKMVINGELSPVIQDIYKVFGIYQARKTTAEINKSAKVKEQKAGFGLDPILLAAIIDYLRQFLLNRVVIPITQTTKDRILEVLIEGETNGWGVDRMVAELDSDEITDARARTIIRTEALKAMEYGQQVAARNSKWETESEWIAANDHRTRHSHRIVDGETVPEGGRFKVPIFKGNVQVGFDMMVGPGDPHASAGNIINCFPCDTEVEGQFIGAQRLKYSGELIEIITISGKRLSVTPNHPIFTDKGTVCANSITEGDYVFSNIKKHQSILTLVNDYIKQKPIKAANLFRTLNNLFASEMVMITGLDLNGDAKFGNGYIDIVDMNGELQFNSESIPEDIGKFSFKSTHLERFFVRCLSSLNKLTLASGYAANSIMRSDNLLSSFTNRHLRPFQFFSIGTSTNWNASRFESTNQNSSTDAAFIRKLLQGNTGSIIADKIIKIRNYNFSGHVYDFSTLSGAILANNIYISNCRCKLATSAARDENGRLIPKRRISVLLPGQAVSNNPIIKLNG